MRNPLRVAIVTTHPIQYYSPLFRKLAEYNGWRLEVMYCRQASAEEQGAAGFGGAFEWDVPLLDGYPYRFLRNVARKPSIATRAGMDTPEVAHSIGDGRFDAVVVHGWHYKSAWQAIRACWKARVPVLVRSDSHLKTPRSATKSLAKWPLYRGLIPRLNACLPVGEWSRDYFLYYGADPARIFVVPHCVDSARLASQAEELGPRREEIRQQWQFAPDKAVWLFAGKFVEKKRPLDFVKAIVRAREDGASVSGLMAGDGPLRPACEAYAASHGGYIRFAGFLNQSKIVEAYTAADALVLPSDGGETWGLVVNEAMACARPCFVSDRVGCGPDLLADGQAGDVFPLGNIEALAGILRRYSQPVLSSMGARALTKIRSHSIESAAESLIEAVAHTSCSSAESAIYHGYQQIS
jgi:glycosyltransferase involved in cell wall biosynthesis